jgi:8-oxo-dGTP pyrophosphatase MutT (NUDIX family)
MSQLTHRIFTDANQEPVPYDGSPVSWRVSAYALVVKDGRLLVIKNKLEKLGDVPGGGIEEGETIVEAIAREAGEEAGVRVKIGSIVYVNQDWFYHRKGQFYQAVQLFYSAELDGEVGQPTDPDIEAVSWLPLDEVATAALPSFVKAAVEALAHAFSKEVDSTT